MKTSILFFGAGFIGSHLIEWHRSRGVCVVVARRDVTDLNAVRTVVRQHRPACIVNCAGKTDIDWCESHRNEAYRVNTLGAWNLAVAAAEVGAMLVQLSTGCIADGAYRLKENAPARPASYYARTKVWADEAIRTVSHRHLILRPRLVVSAQLHARNTLLKLCTYRELIDTANSWTVMEDIPVVLSGLLERQAIGTYNAVNPGITTPYRVVSQLSGRMALTFVPKRISKRELDERTLARRVDVTLSSAKLQAEGIFLKDINDRLQTLLPSFKANLQTPAGRLAFAKVCRPSNNRQNREPWKVVADSPANRSPFWRNELICTNENHGVRFDFARRPYSVDELM